MIRNVCYIIDVVRNAALNRVDVGEDCPHEIGPLVELSAKTGSLGGRKLQPCSLDIPFVVQHMHHANQYLHFD